MEEEESNADNKRILPWARAKDKDAALVGSLIGLIVAVLSGGTGTISINAGDQPDYIKLLDDERRITESQIAVAVRQIEKDYALINDTIEDRLDQIERADAIMVESIKACQATQKQTIDNFEYFQRRFWEVTSK